MAKFKWPYFGHTMQRKYFGQGKRRQWPGSKWMNLITAVMEIPLWESIQIILKKVEYIIRVDTDWVAHNVSTQKVSLPS